MTDLTSGNPFRGIDVPAEPQHRIPCKIVDITSTSIYGAWRVSFTHITEYSTSRISGMTVKKTQCRQEHRLSKYLEATL